MNAAIVPFRLLIVNDSQQEAQRLTSMFQNAGKPCRAQHINSEEAFNKVIEEQGWDLAIAHWESTQLKPSSLIRNIRKHNLDLPVILLTDSEDEVDRSVIDGMKLGANDVVKLDDDQHLLLVINRELENRKQRKLTRAAERKLREVERRNRELLDSSKDGIAYIQDGTLIYSNDSFAEMAGYEQADDIEYVPLMDILKQSDQNRVKASLKDFSLQNESEQQSRLSFHIKGPDGNFKALDCELHLGEFDDEPCIQLFIQASLLDGEVLEAEIENIKTTDPATGLGNKAAFNKELDKAVAAAAEGEDNYGLFYIDIDNFEDKVANVVGVDGTDEVLSTIADFLRSRSQKHDRIARMGDHSFAILSQETHLEKLLTSGNALCAMVRDHFFEVKNKTLRLTCSIGIALVNETSIDSQAIINQANEGIDELRRNHDNGTGDGAHIYQANNDDKTVLVGALQKAMQHNDFKLLFQPIISLRGDETERYEVLLRMMDDAGEEISPNHFLQTAESMNIVTKIDRWVILEAIKHLSAHNKKSGNAQLIVNIHNQSLCDESLLPWLQVAFKAAKVDPSWLIFQARENEVAEHLTTAKKFINDAAAMKVGFCISQFGCALEPLSLLDHIDAQHIKIDGSFTLDLQENTDSTEAMANLLNELHERKKVTTIPMVENATILSKLWKMGAHCIQGHYLQPPNVAMDYEFAVESAG